MNEDLKAGGGEVALALTNPPINVLPNVGCSLLDLIPTDDNVLLKGTAYNSAMGFLNKTYDQGEVFSLEVIGWGEKVEGLTMNAKVKVMPNAEGRIDYNPNPESFESITKLLKGLKKLEYEDFVQDLTKNTGSSRVKFVEYFLCKRYAILAVWKQ